MKRTLAQFLKEESKGAKFWAVCGLSLALGWLFADVIEEIGGMGDTEVDWITKVFPSLADQPIDTSSVENPDVYRTVGK